LRHADAAIDFFVMELMHSVEGTYVPQLAYGVSASCFVDYFQMGITTGRLCFHKVCQCISEDEYLRSKFMRKMNRSDAHRVTELHLKQHGIDGMLGSLDCMHLGWKNCPIAWQGAFQGKEKVLLLYLRLFPITICGFGMLLLDSLVRRMTSIFGSRVLF
jgi:Plant transposon protein